MYRRQRNGVSLALNKKVCFHHYLLRGSHVMSHFRDKLFSFRVTSVDSEEAKCPSKGSQKANKE